MGFLKKHPKNTKKRPQKGNFLSVFSVKKIQKPEVFVVVSKKIDPKAVKRNFIKRRTKEALRQTEYFKAKNKGFGVKIYPTKKAFIANFKDLVKELNDALK